MKDILKRKILLALILFVQLFALFQWQQCRDFADQFHFSSFDLQLRVLDGIHNDTSLPFWEIRIFHNKLLGAIFDVFGEYVQFWNISFLASFLSLAGVIGVALQWYYFFSRKKKHLVVWGIFFALLLAPLVEIKHVSNVPFLARVLFVALPFLLWSMLGYWQLLKEKNLNTKIIDAILLISLWYQLALPTFAAFCALK